MKKEKANKSTISTWKAVKKIRNDFGNISPVTKIIPNKKKNYIPDEYDEFYSMDDCIRDCEYYDWKERYDDFDWEDIDGEYY